MNWNLGIFVTLICISVFVFLALPIHCQEAKQRNIDSLTVVENMDLLNSNFGINKAIPNEYKLHFLIALSFYPELANTTILVRYAKIKTTLNARPSLFSSIFKNKTNRKYIIRITTDALKFSH